MVPTPIGTLIPTINITYASTTILTNKHKTWSQILVSLTMLYIRPLPTHSLTHANSNANSPIKKLLLNQRTRITVGDHRSDSMLQPEKIRRIEDLLVEYHNIFARNRFEIGMNDEFKVKLTPKDDSPAYSQSLPTPINLKEDILVELALLHRNGILTTLPFPSMQALCPIFAQKKPNGKLRLLVDLRKINTLI